MPNYNHFVAIGHLARDPEVRSLKGGDVTVCNGCIAVNSGYGENKKTAFVDFTAWGKTATLIGERLGKGDACLLEGEICQDSWEDKDGNRRSKLFLNVRNMGFMGGKSATGNAPAKPSQATPPPAGDDLDEPPF